MEASARRQYDWMVIRIERRPFGDPVITKRLSVFCAVLAAVWLIAGFVGIARSQAGLIGLGLGLGIFFGLGCWWLWQGAATGKRL
jgi:hypothetical protein